MNELVIKNAERQISTTDFLNQFECCGKKMRVVENSEFLDMDLNSRSFAICETCYHLIEVNDVSLDEENGKNVLGVL